MSSLDYMVRRPEVMELIDLINKAKDHAKKHNIDSSLVINNCSLDANALSEQNYIDGKNYEKQKIRTILGIN